VSRFAASVPMFHIYERVTGPMETRGAGIVVQGDLVQLLRQHHAPDLPMTACRVRRYFDPDGGAGTTQAMPQQFTSWKAIYKTLRATFPDDRYHMGAAVSHVTRSYESASSASRTRLAAGDCCCPSVSRRSTGISRVGDWRSARCMRWPAAAMARSLARPRRSLRRE
jgi:hypothetical protein